MPWSTVVKFYYSVECGFLKGISCLARSLAPVLLPMAADLATVFAAVAIALMERGRKERRRGRGTLRLFITAAGRSSGRITTLESQMADCADRLTDWLPLLLPPAAAF